MLEIVLEMIVCLLIATLIGFVIGYILGKRNNTPQGIEENQDIEEYETKSQTALKIDTDIATKEALEAFKALEAQEKEQKIQETKIDKEEIAVVEAVQKVEEPKVELVEVVDKDEALRPEFLEEPLEVEKDTLSTIKGIGPKLEAKLNSEGIFYFRQIANWSDANIKWLEIHTTLAHRAKKDLWVEQAKALSS